jgi:hypothetical protein
MQGWFNPDASRIFACIKIWKKNISRSRKLYIDDAFESAKGTGRLKKFCA